MRLKKRIGGRRAHRCALATTMITRSLFAFGGLAIAQAPETSSESARTKAIIIAHPIHREVDFHASLARVYEASSRPVSSKLFYWETTTANVRAQLRKRW